MLSTPSQRQLFLRWLIGTPLACALGVAVSVAIDRIFGDASPEPNLGAILPNVATVSTFLYLVAASRARRAAR